jgi:Bacterial low temperature requirement A protein (LtrA)
MVPWAEPLVRHRRRSLSFGYGHLAIFAPLAAMGGGLHVAAYDLEGVAVIGATGTVLSVVIPVSVFSLVLYGLYSTLFRARDPFHLWLLAGTAVLLVAPAFMAAAGVSVTICLLVVALAPVVTVVGFETLGHRHLADVLRQL